MVKAKRKLLPKDFETLLDKADVAALTSVFDACDVNARGGVFKQTALAFSECPDELTRWLVAQGADLAAVDSYGETPLHSRAGHWKGSLGVLIELGADVNHPADGRGTPLHRAAGSAHVDNVRVLLAHGANVDALDKQGMTPLEVALLHGSNATLARVALIADLLLRAGQSKSPSSMSRKLGSWVGKLLSRSVETKTPSMKDYVTRLGTDFEFHRASFNPETLPEASAALDRLYELFDVAPVPRRAMHDGKSPILAKAARWQDQHQELWDLLVPSSGAAATMQGEVIRIGGRIARELEGNGGANWSADHRKMVDAFLAHVQTGKPLPAAELAETTALVAELKAQRGDTNRLCELAVAWVALNPKPHALPTPDYRI